jgi:hypothetical protein
MAKRRTAYALLVPLAVTAVAVSGLALAAPAQAAFVPAIQFTTTVASPDTATAPPAIPNAGSIRLAFTVSNTSNLLTVLGRISITAPAGLTLTAPTVSLPGWTASISGQTLRAVISRPLVTAGIWPTQSIVVGATATNATTVTVPTTSTFTPSATGPLGLIPFKLQGPAPTAVALPAGSAAFAGTPGVALTNLTAPIGTSSANLPNGAIGNVYFGQTTCATTDPTCPRGTEVDLTGNFGTLYSDSAPGSVVVACGGQCPHPDRDDFSKPYDYNYLCTHGSCREGSDPFGEREINEDFNAYPVYVELKGSTSFVQAPRCVAESDLTTTGKIVAPAAVAAGFCVDVNAITRVGDCFTGDLLRPVLFVEDPKMR